MLSSPAIQNFDFSHANRRAILQMLNWRLQFRDPQLQEEFFLFCRPIMLVIITILGVLSFGFFISLNCILTLFYNQMVGEWLFSCLLFFCSSVYLITGLYLIYDCLYIQSMRDKGIATEKKKAGMLSRIHMLNFVALYGMGICSSLRTFFMEDCQSYPTFVQRMLIGWHCGYDSSNIEGFTYPLLIIMPLIIMLVSYEIYVDLVLAGYILCIIAFCIYAAYVGDMNYVWSALGMSLAICATCVELHVFRVSNFLNHRKLRETLLENERMHEESKATELRHMIGNLAHDLKTPLSSLMVGIDMIQVAVNDLEAIAKQHRNTDIVTSIHTIQQCFKSVFNTHSFMLMTINRCIDYTKASKGLKLLPKYDTIDLMETLKIPFECMSNIQERIKIELLPMTSEICSHIITDKQWLQENVLCLLSNAVKYSAEGTVTIRMLLENVDLLQEEPTEQNQSQETKGQEPGQERSDLEEGYTSPRSITSGLSSLLHTPQIHPFVGQSNSFSDVLNPQKHSNIFKRSPTVAITSSFAQQLRFEIEDNGIGLTEEAMPLLFNPFQRAQRMAGGTGLGLYSLAMRLEALKGRYGVSHRRDGKQGSLFWFEIPYRPDTFSASIDHRIMQQTNSFAHPIEDVASKQQQQEEDSSPIKPIAGIASIPTTPHEVTTPKTISSSNSSKHMPMNTLSVADRVEKRPLYIADAFNVLVVDDSPTIMKMVTMMLRLKGHTVTSAENGLIALNILQQTWQSTGHGFDVILMDLQMPIMDGLEATRRLRTLEQQTDHRIHIPHQMIVGMSANSDHETMEASYCAGMDDFMIKPFHMDAFLDIVQKYATQSQQQPQQLSQ